MPRRKLLEENQGKAEKKKKAARYYSNRIHGVLSPMCTYFHLNVGLLHLLSLLHPFAPLLPQTCKATCSADSKYAYYGLQYGSE